ncbi:MAG: hypothetical protein AB1410_10995 [Acidobacteriota bacterium]
MISNFLNNLYVVSYNRLLDFVEIGFEKIKGKKERGQTTIEYLVLAILLVAIIVAMVTIFWRNINTWVRNAIQRVQQLFQQIS